jgi:hypothetical protein
VKGEIVQCGEMDEHGGFEPHFLQDGVGVTERIDSRVIERDKKGLFRQRFALLIVRFELAHRDSGKARLFEGVHVGPEGFDGNGIAPFDRRNPVIEKGDDGGRPLLAEFLKNFHGLIGLPGLGEPSGFAQDRVGIGDEIFLADDPLNANGLDVVALFGGDPGQRVPRATVVGIPAENEFVDPLGVFPVLESFEHFRFK